MIYSGLWIFNPAPEAKLATATGLKLPRARKNASGIRVKGKPKPASLGDSFGRGRSLGVAECVSDGW